MNIQLVKLTSIISNIIDLCIIYFYLGYKLLVKRPAPQHEPAMLAYILVAIVEIKFKKINIVLCIIIYKKHLGLSHQIVVILR